MKSPLLVSLLLILGSLVQDGHAEESSSRPVVRIGAVAYAPSAVTIFSDLKKYLNRHDFPCDYVLYSNYDALVAALDKGEVDIAWNTPLAHAQYHVGNKCASQTLVMRDVDVDVHSVLIVRADSGIESIKDLSGKRLVVGSADAAEATVLPLHYLSKQGVELETVQLVSLDQEVDFKGNPCCSPEYVLQAVREGRGEAGIITEDLWQSISQEGNTSGELKAAWTSPAFSHCVFTASASFDPALGKRFQDLMTSMSAEDPETAELMRLEGARKWLPGSPDGFSELVTALQDQD